jgi:hypothetical protein
MARSVSADASLSRSEMRQQGLGIRPNTLAKMLPCGSAELSAANSRLQRKRAREWHGSTPSLKRTAAAQEAPPRPGLNRRAVRT